MCVGEIERECVCVCVCVCVGGGGERERGEVDALAVFKNLEGRRERFVYFFATRERPIYLTAPTAKWLQ